MKTIGSHPGAILFRLSMMVVVVAILVSVFFSYIGRVQQNTERAAVIRTRGIIDSSLVLVFATYAVQGRLDQLNDLDGANPFDLLPEYNLLPPSYIGEIDHDLTDSQQPGWYYLSHRREVAYKPRYLDRGFRYELVLKYRDNSQSGRFDPGTDSFRGLYFVKLPQAD